MRPPLQIASTKNNVKEIVPKVLTIRIKRSIMIVPNETKVKPGTKKGARNHEEGKQSI